MSENETYGSNPRQTKQGSNNGHLAQEPNSDREEVAKQVEEAKNFHGHSNKHPFEQHQQQPTDKAQRPPKSPLLKEEVIGALQAQYEEYFEHKEQLHLRRYNKRLCQQQTDAITFPMASRAVSSRNRPMTMNMSPKDDRPTPISIDMISTIN